MPKWLAGFTAGREFRPALKDNYLFYISLLLYTDVRKITIPLNKFLEYFYEETFPLNIQKLNIDIKEGKSCNFFTSNEYI